MGFGSYDESEQEQQRDDTDKAGETVTNQFKSDQADAKGEATTEDAPDEELMKHL